MAHTYRLDYRTLYWPFSTITGAQLYANSPQLSQSFGIAVHGRPGVAIVRDDETFDLTNPKESEFFTVPPAVGGGMHSDYRRAASGQGGRDG